MLLVHREFTARRLLRLLFWAVFALGLVLQAFSPHLKIKDNGFVLPPLSADAQLNPIEIVNRERRIQLFSAFFTLAGAAGLASCYREILIGRRSARPDLAGINDVPSDSSQIVT